MLTTEFRRITDEELNRLNGILAGFGLHVSSGSIDEENKVFTFIDKGCAATYHYDRIAKIFMDFFCTDRVVLDGTDFCRENVEKSLAALGLLNKKNTSYFA